MEKMTSVMFTCPGCERTFEFDPIGEYELVSCPMCQNEFITVRKNQALLLEPFEFNVAENSSVLG